MINQDKNKEVAAQISIQSENLYSGSSRQKEVWKHGICRDLIN